MDKGYGALETKFEFHNFHDPEKLSHIQDAILNRQQEFSVLLLHGEIGSGRDYCLQSVIYRLRRARPQHRYDYAPLDLQGFTSDAGPDGLKQFADQLVQKYGDTCDKRLLEEVIRLKSGQASSSIIDGIQLSVLPHVAITIKAIKELLRFHPNDQFKAPQEEGRALFHQMIQRLCGDRRLLLHVVQPELLNDVVFRWLMDEARITENLCLAFSDGLYFSRVEEYCNNWDVPYHTFYSRPHTVDELKAIVDTKYSPNNFDRHIYQLFFDCSRGHTKQLALTFKTLLSHDYIRETAQGWKIDHRAGIPKPLSAKLYDPIDDILHQCGEFFGPKLSRFLYSLALCGGIGPGDLVCGFLGLFDENRDQLIDLIDSHLVEGDSPLLIDHQYAYPSFKGHVVYSFREKHLVSMILDRYGEGPKEQQAADLFRFFNAQLPIASKEDAYLMLRLAKIGRLYNDIEGHNQSLCWWIENSQADALKEGLIRELKTGKRNPSLVWAYIERQEGRNFSAVKKLALLDAFNEQPDGIPTTLLVPFLIKRSGTLYHLGRYNEALTDILQADRLTGDTEAPIKGAIKNMAELCLQDAGSYNEALPYLKRALEIRKKTLGEPSGHGQIHGSPGGAVSGTGAP